MVEIYYTLTCQQEQVQHSPFAHGSAARAASWCRRSLVLSCFLFPRVIPSQLFLQITHRLLTHCDAGLLERPDFLQLCKRSSKKVCCCFVDANGRRLNEGRSWFLEEHVATATGALTVLTNRSPRTNAHELQMVRELQQQHTRTKLCPSETAHYNSPFFFLFYTFCCAQIKLLLTHVQTKLVEEEMGGNFRYHWTGTYLMNFLVEIPGYDEKLDILLSW